MSDVLLPGEKLVPGDVLRSPSGGYSLVLQPDGNLVLHAVDGTALWSTGTQGCAAVEAWMQPDGNFVLYSHGKVVWSSHTSGYPGAFLKVLSGIGAVIETETHRPWSTNIGSWLAFVDRAEDTEGAASR